MGGVIQLYLEDSSGHTRAKAQPRLDSVKGVLQRIKHVATCTSLQIHFSTSLPKRALPPKVDFFKITSPTKLNAYALFIDPTWGGGVTLGILHTPTSPKALWDM